MINPKKEVAILLTSVFIIAICGILYELLISSVSSYFLGSSILHFSITIGLFMSSMGLGSFLSKFIEKDFIDKFILIEMWLGLIGGFSAFILYSSFSLTENYYLIAFTLIVFLGMCIGLEIPLISRIIERHSTFKDTIAEVFSFDYLGALIASILFPLLLLPYFGTLRTSFLIGLLNIAVGFLNYSQFKSELKNASKIAWLGIISLFLLLIGFTFSFQINTFFESYLYQDHIIYSEQSAYQKVVITKWNNDHRLYLNGNLQFSSIDEHRYHETLVHTAALATSNPEDVLILGGGDGLAVRELQKYKSIKSIDLVDLDPAMTNLGKDNPILTKLNNKSLSDSKVKIFNQDAFNFVEKSEKTYNLIIIDLPDPNDLGLGKLYTKEFYGLIAKRLSPGGTMISQSTSPYFAPWAFWCIHRTMEKVWPMVIPLNVYVPTFGNWGFNIVVQPFPKMIQNQDYWISKIKTKLAQDSTYKFLNPKTLETLFVFDQDCQELPAQINNLESQILMQYYESSWKNFHN